MQLDSIRNTLSLAIFVVLSSLLGVLLSTQPVLSQPVLPTVSIRSSDLTAAEWGPDPGTFTVFLSVPATSTLTVNYTVGGTATPEVDYASLSGSVTLPAGSTRAEISVTPFDDVIQEGEETVIVNLSPGEDYLVGPPVSDTVIIADDDTPIRISLNPVGIPWLHLWDPLSGRLFEGPNTTGQPIAFFNIDRGQGLGRIHRGSNATGEILFTVDFRTGRVWDGPNPTGALVYTLNSVSSRRGPEVRIRQGSEKGPIVYTINDDDMYQGPTVSGLLVFHTNRPVWGPIQFLLPLIAARYVP